MYSISVIAAPMISTVTVLLSAVSEMCRYPSHSERMNIMHSPKP